MKKTTILILIVIFSLLAIDILIRIFYCSGIYLKFNSEEFNNIVSPIISIFGFSGVIFIILISIKQLRTSISERYLINYNEYIKNLCNEININDKDNNNNIAYNKSQLLKFSSHVLSEYEVLLEDKNYVKNQMLIKSKKSNLLNESYEPKLATLRYFHIKCLLFYKEMLYKLKEIISNRQIISEHQDILLSNFIGDVISFYIAHCEMIKQHYSKMIDDFFIGIETYPKNKRYVLFFFNNDFFELYNFIMKDKNLKRFYK